MRVRVAKATFSRNWKVVCQRHGRFAMRPTWTEAMEAAWGHEAMRHSRCPDCEGTGCSECAWRNWGHDECYCVFCFGTGVVCSS